ncbi:MAG TPA: P1 family peptidase [Candidatus Angelobacter sp.]|nr:P1 family peptidase [Candidatus Angelobacter sp.]
MQRREFTQSLLALMAAAGSGGPALAQPAAQSESEPAASFGLSLTAVTGIKVGHFTSQQRPTGCTVVLCEAGAVAGVDVRGSAPGTRETDLLNPVNAVQQIHAITLTGGSAFGLDAATGVMRYLEEHGIGFKFDPQAQGRKTGYRGVVPIVPAAVLFDLDVGDGAIRPNAESGYQASHAASTGPVAEGNVGAGAGATVGKMFGMQFAMKSGVGSAGIKVGSSEIVVAGLAAVNAVGDVIDPANGKILGGARAADGRGFRNSMAEILRGYQLVPTAHASTTLGVVATNVAFDKTQMTKIAQMAHDGLARTINPVHTPFDGDTIFALSTGSLKLNVNHGLIGAIAAEVMAQAIIRAVKMARGLPGLPSFADITAKG